MRIRSVWGTGLLVMGAWCAGCAASRQGDGEIGIDDDRLLRDLEQVDRDQLCDALIEGRLGASEADTHALVCALNASLAVRLKADVGEADLATACRATRDECLDTPLSELRSENLTCTISKPFPASCEANVGELLDCMNAAGAVVREAANLLACDRIVASESPGNPDSLHLDNPPECDHLEARCEDFDFSGTGVQMGNPGD